MITPQQIVLDSSLNLRNTTLKYDSRIWGSANLEFVKQKKDIDGLMNPDDIASNYLWIHNQPRNAWTHELDLRPWVEKW